VQARPSRNVSVIARQVIESSEKFKEVVANWQELYKTRHLR
jgi:hypothetical protein